MDEEVRTLKAELSSKEEEWDALEARLVKGRDSIKQYVECVKSLDFSL